MSWVAPSGSHLECDLVDWLALRIPEGEVESVGEKDPVDAGLVRRLEK